MTILKDQGKWMGWNECPKIKERAIEIVWFFPTFFFCRHCMCISVHTGGDARADHLVNIQAFFKCGLHVACSILLLFIPETYNCYNSKQFVIFIALFGFALIPESVNRLMTFWHLWLRHFCWCLFFLSNYHFH